MMVASCEYIFKLWMLWDATQQASNVMKKLLQIYYINSFLNSKLLQNTFILFLAKTRIIFITMHSLAFSYLSQFNFLSRLCNKFGFCSIQMFKNNQQFKPNHMFIIIEYHNFWWMIKLVFWNVFKIWMSVWYMRNVTKAFSKMRHVLKL